MRHYEAMYILDPALTEEQVPPIIERYSKVVTDMGGEVSDASLWEGGRRPLAYTIAGRREGIYVLMQFVAGKDVPAELDRLFKISDNVLRHIVVRPDPDEE
ncbi:MAG: 30S ribosomal protein S6 [Chthonomonadales bacterium]|nr:30S ribosomal protein S6 [Chthonomonadales bacterium]